MNKASAEWLKTFINEHDPELFAYAHSDGEDDSRAAWYVICESFYGDDLVVYDGLSAYMINVIRVGGPLLQELLIAWEKAVTPPAQKILLVA